MHEQQLFGRPSGRRARKPYQRREPVAEDLINRQFYAERPNHKWISDISEIKTRQGKLVFCQVRDLYDGVIVGWSLDTRMQAQLVLDALKLARHRRVDDQELIFHSDRGSQYTSQDLQKYLKKHPMKPSMGAVGNAADNAAAESFFGQLKREIKVNCRQDTHDEAKRRIHDYIINLYNLCRRIQSTDKAWRPAVLSHVEETDWHHKDQLQFENP